MKNSKLTLNKIKVAQLSKKELLTIKAAGTSNVGQGTCQQPKLVL